MIYHIMPRNETLYNLNEAKQAIKRTDRIIQEWEENYIGSREAIELLAPDLKTIICYFETIQGPEEEES
ncbi:hypothetical protein KA005_73145 [bacterium]|nr:hypothetical protein [bacterium]